MEKCVQSLDDNEAFFDDILSPFINMFNKREYYKFLKNQEYTGAIMMKPHTTNQLCFEGKPHREKASFINRILRMKIEVDG